MTTLCANPHPFFNFHSCNLLYRKTSFTLISLTEISCFVGSSNIIDECTLI